jgi:hypothetical protein
VVTPNNGFLTIVKVDTETGDSTPFTFNVSPASQNGTSSWTINGSGSVQLVSFAPGAAYDLSEVIPEGWALDSVSCEIQTATPEATGTPGATGVTDFEIRSGLPTICTFTDSKKPKLTVIKVVDPATDTGLFTLNINGTVNAK